MRGEKPLLTWLGTCYLLGGSRAARLWVDLKTSDKFVGAVMVFNDPFAIGVFEQTDQDKLAIREFKPVANVWE
tara:strand:- start:233 stop:451 length:219 start_codon:yes stop_codon:yes gene_type:complete